MRLVNSDFFIEVKFVEMVSTEDWLIMTPVVNS